MQVYPVPGSALMLGILHCIAWPLDCPSAGYVLHVCVCCATQQLAASGHVRQVYVCCDQATAGQLPWQVTTTVGTATMPVGVMYVGTYVISPLPLQVEPLFAAPCCRAAVPATRVVHCKRL